MKSKKIKIILGVILVLLIAIRIALPVIIKDQLNSFLGTFSKHYAFHIDDVDLSIIRGAYRLEGIQGTLKNPQEKFFAADYIDISLSWRDLFRGHIRTDVLGSGVELIGNQAFIKAIQNQAADSKKDAKQLGEKVFPVDVSRIDLRNSKVTFADVNGLPEELKLRLTQIDGRVTNVTATEKEPNSLINIRGVFQDSATGILVGEVNQKSIPAEWLFSFEAKEFDITSLNDFLKRRVPMTIKQGRTDIYAEVKGENGNVYGYVKPFVKDLQMMGDQSDFSGIKQWGVEAVTGISNFILRSSKDQTVATKFNFAYEAGEFKWNLGEMLGKAFQHGFGGDLKPGLENQFKMNDVKPKQDQKDQKQP